MVAGGEGLNILAQQIAPSDWLLAQLKPNGMRLAVRNLARQGYEVFNPLHQVTRRRNGEFVTREEQLFPDYLFVTLGESTSNWSPINGTLGVSRLVGFGGRLAKAPPSLISALRARCDAAGILSEPSTIDPGDRVQLISGPFADFVAEVHSIDPDRRVWILLDIMGRATRVGVAAHEVKVV